MPLKKLGIIMQPLQANPVLKLKQLKGLTTFPLHNGSSKILGIVSEKMGCNAGTHLSLLNVGDEHEYPLAIFLIELAIELP